MVAVLATAKFAASAATSGPLAIAAPVGSTVLVVVMVNAATALSVTDNRGHTYSTHTPAISGSGTISICQMFWTKVTTANPSVTVTRGESGALAVDVLALSGEVSGAVATTAGQGTSMGMSPVGGSGLAIWGLAALTSPTWTPASGWTLVDSQVVGTRRLETRTGPTSAEPDATFSVTNTYSAATVLMVDATPVPSADLTVWDGSALVAVEVLGVWNGASIEEVEVLGMWDGSGIVEVEGVS